MINHLFAILTILVVAWMGKGGKMLDYIVIEHNVTIGENTIIEPFTVIKSGSFIGSNCIIGAHCRIAKECVIGDGCDIRSGSLLGPNTVLEEDVFLGASVICTSPSFHDPKKVASTVIEKGVRIGAGTVILPGMRIYQGVQVGALSLINRPLVSPGMYFGIPVRFREKSSTYTQTCVPMDNWTDGQRIASIKYEIQHGQQLIAIKGDNFIFENKV